jgi:hypothetical protein
LHWPELEYGSEAGHSVQIRIDQIDAHGSAQAYLIGVAPEPV